MSPSASPRTVVAIPVCNEEALIQGCLDALARQEDGPPDDIVLLLNNCTDGSRAAIEAARPGLNCGLHVESRNFPAGSGGAGWARALAMNVAARLAGPCGVLLTTDADGQVAPDWLRANLRALRAGADAVAGRAVIDPLEARLIPQALHDDDAREVAYATLLDQIASLLDPDPADPWPRHTEASGASLAVTAAWYRRVGGMPWVRSGEDRAFEARLRRHDARVRHAPEVWVTVSGRIEGRAPGGMAETIKRRMSFPDKFLDDRLEPALDATRRARLRHMLRAALRGGGPGVAARETADVLGFSFEHLELLLSGSPYFGTVWDAVEAASPALRRQRVPVAHLARETRAAQTLLDRLLEVTYSPPPRVGAGRNPAENRVAAALKH